RIFVRKAITEPAGAFLVDLFKSGLPAFDTGTPYVPRDMLAVVHRGERIVRAEENRRGGWNDRPGISIAPTIYIDSRTDRAQIAVAVDQAMRLSERRIFENMRRGGAFANA
ncbi:MAG: hypothetical protein AB1761_18495, partial [Pseudomonadota bacterium]